MFRIFCLLLVALTPTLLQAQIDSSDELLKLQLEVAQLVQRMDAVEKTVQTAPVITKPAYSMPTGRVLYMFYSPNCTDPCVIAKEAVQRSGVPVVQLNVYEEPFEAIKLWQGCDLEFAVPAWVLVENDKPIKRWVGATPKTSVVKMAEYRPFTQSNSVITTERTVVLGQATPVEYHEVVGQMDYVQPQVVQRSIPPARRTWYHNGGGSLADHIARVHGINPAGMSHQDMVNAHSHAHEGTWNSAYAQRQQEYYVRRSQPVRTQRTFTPVRNLFRTVLGAGGCPSGACPF